MYPTPYTMLPRCNAEGKAPPKSTPSVGKYAVDVHAFEALAVPSISVIPGKVHFRVYSLGFRV